MNTAESPGSAVRPFVWATALVALATALRLGWVLAVPTVPVGDFAMYRESANYLSEFGRLDPGFIYMPGFVYLLALVKDLGGNLLAQKMIGVVFGGLGAAGVFGATYYLFDRDPAAHASVRAPSPTSVPTSVRPSCATAITATLLYAVWPAGVAMSSVVGTDVPAAALMLVALACLAGWADNHPWRAAVAFGVVMGLAAYVRAVALPLTALSAFFWLARRRQTLSRLTDVMKLTAVSVVATLLVLLPWALRNKRHDGELFFTDSHGGITALIGANPNSEGTYTRALNQMFKEATGRSVLDEPHRQVDRAAYRLAVEWTRFQPAYALGLGVKRAGRLFDIERRLLYWPITRPGVLLPPHSTWFEAHRAGIELFTDVFGALLVTLFLAGIALAVAEGRAPALTLLPFQVALAATYIIFFAEPRYRIPIEMMAFPVVAAAVVGLGRLGARLLAGEWRALRVTLGALFLAALLIAGIFLLAPTLMEAGAGLRSRHRWAASMWTVNEQRRISLWRRTEADVRQSPTGPSPLEGALDGVRLRLPPDGSAAAQARVTISGGPLPAGSYQLTADVEKRAGSERSPPLVIRFQLAPGPAAPVASAQLDDANPGLMELSGVFRHPGGPLQWVVTLERATPSPAPAGPVPAGQPIDVSISNALVAPFSDRPPP